jgi:hypothetical protein
MLENRTEVQQKLISSNLKGTGKEVGPLIDFMRYLRQTLWETKEFRPLIEFYSLEEAQKVRDQVVKELEQLTNTIDGELRAIRVTIVDHAPDFEAERQLYLRQLEVLLEEQDFLGFPDLKEKQPTLLKNVYIPLKLNYDRGGEALDDELGNIVLKQASEKE